MSLRDRAQHKPLPGILLEVLLIAIGVFLALWASNWHEQREHRALADSTLRNFADEMRANQKAVQASRQYHEALARELEQFFASNQPPTEEQFSEERPF